jgi:hypothetical protein
MEFRVPAVSFDVCCASNHRPMYAAIYLISLTAIVFVLSAPMLGGPAVIHPCGTPHNLSCLQEGAITLHHTLDI